MSCNRPHGRKIKTSVIAGLILLALAATSCGYSIRKSPAVREVRIGEIKNMSFEPSIQDTFIRSLERELTRRGVRIDRSAAHEVEGSITSVSLRGTAEEDNVTIQYQVTIKGNFHLNMPDDIILELKNRDNFIVNFSGRGQLSRVMTNKERALETALSNLAADVASDIASVKAGAGTTMKKKEMEVK